MSADVRACPTRWLTWKKKKQGNRGNLLLWPYQFFDVRLFYVFPVYGFASNGSLQGVMIKLCRFSNVFHVMSPCSAYGAAAVGWLKRFMWIHSLYDKIYVYRYMPFPRPLTERYLHINIWLYIEI